MDVSPFIPEGHYKVWDEEYLDCNNLRLLIGFTAKNVFTTNIGTSGEIDRPFIRMTDLKAIRIAEERKAQWEADEREERRRQEEEQRGTFRP